MVKPSSDAGPGLELDPTGDPCWPSAADADAECSKHHRMGAAARQTPGLWGSVLTLHMREGELRPLDF